MTKISRQQHEHMSRVQVLVNGEQDDWFSPSGGILHNRNAHLESRGSPRVNNSSRQLNGVHNVGTSPEILQHQRSLFQQYRIQYLQHNQNARQTSNAQQQQQPQSVAPIVSSAHNCPPVLEGHLVCLGDCLFPNERSRNELQKTIQQLGGQVRVFFSKKKLIIIV